MKAFVRAYLATHPCFTCGATKRLHFHHVDPSTKRFAISTAYVNRLGLAAIRAEIAKCVVLCGSCHGTVHGLMRRLALDTRPPV